MKETRERTCSDGTAITQRLYEMKTGPAYWCPEKSCVFCKHCDDIIYDSHGPYMFFCNYQMDPGEDYTNLGYQGKCEKFEENEEVD